MGAISEGILSTSLEMPGKIYREDSIGLNIYIKANLLMFPVKDVK